MIRDRKLILSFRFILGGVFIWSGILKVIDPVGFAQDIANYRLFPQTLVLLGALVLPWIEVFSGILILLRKWQRSSAFVLSSLLIFFLILIGVTLVRGIDVDCGCFGPLSRKVDLVLILTDCGLLFLSLSVFLSGSSRKLVRS